MPEPSTLSYEEFGRVCRAMGGKEDSSPRHFTCNFTDGREVRWGYRKGHESLALLDRGGRLSVEVENVDNYDVLEAYPTIIASRRIGGGSVAQLHIANLEGVISPTLRILMDPRSHRGRR